MKTFLPKRHASNKVETIRVTANLNSKNKPYVTVILAGDVLNAARLKIGDKVAFAADEYGDACIEAHELGFTLSRNKGGTNARIQIPYDPDVFGRWVLPQNISEYMCHMGRLSFKCNLMPPDRHHGMPAQQPIQEI